MTTRCYAPKQGDYIFPPFVDIAGDTSPDSVTVLASNAVLSAKADVDRAEFLRAVETELNVKIINRADLPTVTEGPDGSLNARGATLTSDGNAYGSDALGWHAIAEHLEAHPPVDQAAVDALIESIVRADDNADLTGAQVANLARRLIRAGVRPPKAD